MNEGAAEETGPRPACIAVDDVHHRFDALEALRGVSLTVRHGETFGLLGPNGSGKSTLLALLAGQLRLQQGEIEVDGAPLTLTGRGWREWASRLGTVFQSPALDPQLEVVENLQLAGRMHGLRGQALSRAVEAALEMARLRGRRQDRVESLSGGMRRRLDLSRALIHRPDVLLLDEPTSGLDEASFQGFWSVLAQIQDRRPLTVVVATHRPAEADRCDRVAILNAGRLVTVDAPDALRSSLERDRVIVTCPDPTQLAVDVEAQFPEQVRRCLVEGGKVHIACQRGHELVPRLVEALSPGRIEAIEFRQASLADVFLQLTGHSLEADAVARSAGGAS